MYIDMYIDMYGYIFMIDLYWSIQFNTVRSFLTSDVAFSL